MKFLNLCYDLLMAIKTKTIQKVILTVTLVILLLSGMIPFLMVLTNK
jgi:hypothetical protein